MILNIDIDGVTADFTGGFAARYAEWFGVELPAVQGWADIFETTHFASEEALWDWTDRVPEFWRRLPPIGGAFGGIDILRQAGHQVNLVTARHEKTRIQTLAWVADHLGPDAPTVHHVTKSEKHKVPGTFWLDDSPDVLGFLEESVGPDRVYRFVRPWNKGAPGIPIKSWEAFVLRVLEKGAL